MRATVVSGVQKAADFVSLPWVHDQLAEWLGVEPFPGTLNLRLEGAPSVASWERRKAAGDDIVLPPGEAGYCSAHWFPVLVDGVPAGIIRPDVDGYPADVVEVVAGEHLRSRLGLSDGDEVTLSWP